MKDIRSFHVLFALNIILICALFLQNRSPYLQDYGQLISTPEIVSASPTPGPVFPELFLSRNLGEQEEALVSLYRAVSQGVVSLQMETPIGTRQGSGFVVDKDGHIVTNYHVIKLATYIEVILQNGIRSEGIVIGSDKESDLAVIAVDIPEEDLVPLVFGNSDDVVVGQLVIAIGSPFGFGGTMSTGIVSNLTRAIPSLNEFPSGGLDVFAVGDLIQTDAAINPGNSGGPLLNTRGEVIGVNRAIQTYYYSMENASMSSGIGFAISANVVKRVVPELIEHGRYDYPYLGLTALNQLTLAAAEKHGLDRTTGAFIRIIDEGGPAERAGLQQDDLIIRVNGYAVNSSIDLAAFLLTNVEPGDLLFLSVLRQGEEFLIELTIETLPEEEE